MSLRTYNTHTIKSLLSSLKEMKRDISRFEESVEGCEKWINEKKYNELMDIASSIYYCSTNIKQHTKGLKRQ